MSGATVGFSDAPNDRMCYMNTKYMNYCQKMGRQIIFSQVRYSPYFHVLGLSPFKRFPPKIEIHNLDLDLQSRR